jgi:HlyD family secretion protein
VQVAIVDQGPFWTAVSGEGETRVRHRFVLSAPVLGRLERVTLSEGDSVRANQLVARIDPGPLDARARAEWEASLRGAEDARREAAARLRQAQSSSLRTTRDAARVRVLYDSGQISQRELEASTAAEARDREEVAASDFRLQQLTHEVERIRAALGEPGGGAGGSVPIRCPVAGVVLRVLQRDERVVPAGEPLVEIGDPRDLEFVVDVLSTDAVAVQPGVDASIDGWGGDTALRARVRLVEPSAFTKTSALGVDEQRVNVILDLVSPAPRLGDRFRITAHIITWQSAQSLTVPVSALMQTASDHWSAYVVRRGRLAVQPVQVGHTDGRRAEIVRGLTVGDTVVTEAGEALRVGQRLRPILQADKT